MSKSNIPLGTPIECTEATKLVSYYRIESDTKNLLGKILTLIDASISDKQQNKAFKDLVKQDFRDFLFQYQEFFWEGKQGHNPIN